MATKMKFWAKPKCFPQHNLFSVIAGEDKVGREGREGRRREKEEEEEVVSTHR